MVLFLKKFYDLIVKVSRTKYVTSSGFFNDISHTNVILKEMMKSESAKLIAMARSTKDKLKR